MAAALDGIRSHALSGDQDRRHALCRGRNASAVTSAYWAKPQEPGSQR